MKGKYYESDYEKAVVDLLQGIGWEYTHGSELHNRKITEPLLLEDLTLYLYERYAEKGLTGDEFQQVIANIQNISGDSYYDTLRKTVNLYREGYDLIPSYPGALPFRLEYIDFDNPERNIFRVVNQFEMLQRSQERIPDVMLFINGIPVCIIELKNPTDENATIRNAHTQITVRYRRDIPLLLKYCALACISDGSNTRLGNTVTGYEFFYAWKKVENEDAASRGLGELRSLISGVFTPERILEILRDFVYFPDRAPGEEEKEIEIVCRYPQYFAAKKLQSHVLQHLRSAGGDGKGGTYFGATGCGKTYTMLFLSRLLAMRSKQHLGNPTILLIVDREDLENQADMLFSKSTEFLGSKSVRTIKNRDDLAQELTTNNGGGFYVTTVQKFTEKTGLLSDRSDIICLSDEAHRTQTNTGSKLVIKDRQAGGKNTEKLGAFISYGFAKYLRDALPNATYVGFTGTPIDETIHVFGKVVDKYTMIQAQADGITVPLKYDPRLIRVFLDSEKAHQVEEYYRQCESDGAKPEDVDKSKKAMSSMNVLLGDEGVLHRLAADIILDYENRCAEQPDCLMKAMVTCSERNIAVKLYNIIKKLKPEWCRPVKALDETGLDAERLKKLTAIPFVNVVATTGRDDPQEMVDVLGDDQHRKLLDKEFKREDSNFHIAIVVDMWITGFDVPPLTILYNYKPLKKHTLIQTISRVNRVYRGKEYGFIVDYIGIRENMKEAMKQYGGEGEDKVEDIEAAHSTLANQLDILKKLLHGLDFTPFFENDGVVRLLFLQNAAEYILSRSVKEKGKPSFDTVFKGHVRRLKSAYSICSPAGVLSDEEVMWSQCFMGIYAYMNKITDTHLDVATMNRAVEKMVQEAITCGGVENVMDFAASEEDIFSEKFLQELDNIKLPCTKFQLLVKLLNRAIKEYSKTNKVRADHFANLLAQTVEAYNTRDRLEFTNNVARDTVNAVNSIVEEKVRYLTENLLNIFRNLDTDKAEFRKLGISFEEKAFYDILVDLRDRHKFEYEDDRCIDLARKINELISDTAIYADWLNNDNLKNKLSSELLKTIYHAGYPPQWSEEIFNKVLEQVENFKRYEYSEFEESYYEAAESE